MLPRVPQAEDHGPRLGFSPKKPDPQAREAERLLAQRLKGATSSEARQLGLAAGGLRTRRPWLPGRRGFAQLFFGKVGRAWWMWKRRAVAGMVLSVRALIRVWG